MFPRKVLRFPRNKTLFCFIFFILLLVYLWNCSGSKWQLTNRVVFAKQAFLNYYSHHNYSYLVVRVLSNDLTPLHGENQTYLHVRFIVENEMLPAEFGRLWILHAMVDTQKQSKIQQYLTSKHEWVEILPLPNTNNVSILQQAAFDLNKPRNFALKLGFDAGAKWIFPFDGSSFFTRESYRALQNVVTQANTTYIMHYVPMVRLQQRIASLNSYSSYQSIFPYISGQEECQIAVSRRFSEQRNTLNLFREQSGFFFRDNQSYGNQDKLSSLRLFNKTFSNKLISCKQAFIGYSKLKATNASVDVDLMSRCGYMIRLPYHPEPDAPIHQQLTAKKRARLRYSSMVEFTRQLALHVNNTNNNGPLPQFPWS